jgi:hypothetical protein
MSFSFLAFPGTFREGEDTADLSSQVTRAMHPDGMGR